MKKYLFVLLAFILLGCHSLKNPTADLFYQDDGGFNNYGRFPLIKPYEAIIVSEEQGWYVDLLIPPSQKAMYYYIGLQDVRKVAVENGVIMAYTPSMTVVDEKAGQKVFYWFVVIPDKKIEAGFDNEDDFLNYIQKYGIEKPSWESPESIFQKYKETGCLNWIPDCK